MGGTMKLPWADEAVISEAKFKEYLLSEEHPLGRTKAHVLKRFGYTSESWIILAKDLRTLARENDVVLIETSPFGTRFVVDGLLHTPNGRELLLRSVWFIDIYGGIPHFVTAYPR